MLWLFVTLTLRRAAQMTLDLGPYVVAGVLLGEAVRYTPALRWLEAGCRRRPVVAVGLCTTFGAASPLCTYGTVPVVLRLVRSGVPVAPLVAFLATSSLINPQLFVITWGGLGPRLALVQLASVLVLGLMLGTVVQKWQPRWTATPLLRPELDRESPLRSFTWSGYARSSWKTLQFVGFYVLVGIFIGAALQVAVPGHWFLRVFGRHGWLQILLAALLGVPLYACGGAVVPLLAYLVGEGMSPAAALAFLLAGPATRITALMALATLARVRFVAAYAIGVIAYAFCVGLLLASFGSSLLAPDQHGPRGRMPMWSTAATGAAFR